MSEMIIVALLGLIGTVFGGFAGVTHKTRKQAVADAAREAQQAEHYTHILNELENVNKRLDEHNGYAEKFAQYSVSIASLSKDIEYIKEKAK